MLNDKLWATKKRNKLQDFKISIWKLNKIL